MIKYSGLNIEPIFGPALDGDVQQTKANIDLIKKEIGWKPSIMLVDWIKDIISSKKFNEI
jgi:nucleoside-diphosphate-sugar epimerase